MADYSRAHICQCLTRLSSVKRDSVVTVYGYRWRTGQEFVDGVLGLAGGLIRLGLRNGDVVAFAALNSDVYLEWLLAVAFIGGIAAPLNYRWSLKEASTAMLMVEPVLLVTDENCSSWNLGLEDSDIPSLKWRVLIDSSSTSSANEHKRLTTEMLKQQSSASPPPTYKWTPTGAVVICFTSGTTGRPKGVMLSHTAFMTQSLAKIAIVGYGEDDVYLHTAPLGHIGGLSSAMAMLMVGACHVLLPKFDAETTLKAIEQHRVTCLITVPAMMADLLSVNRAKRHGTQKESVRKILNGGGSLSSELIKDATGIFPRAKILSAYGMTEACSSLTFMTLYDPKPESCIKDSQIVYTDTFASVNRTRGICVGKPPPNVELKVQPDDSSSIGKILTRGPHIMLGYWGQVQENVPTSGVRNGAWLDTGDIGAIDRVGNLWLIGRSNGRIKTGGENVYPEEVEAVLSQHAGIVSAVVVGVPDVRLAEMVIACVRLRDNWEWSDRNPTDPARNQYRILSSEILRRHCRTQNLTGFKIPRLFVPWKKRFPATTTGKIRRDEVRRDVMCHLQNLPSFL